MKTRRFVVALASMVDFEYGRNRRRAGVGGTTYRRFRQVDVAGGDSGMRENVAAIGSTFNHSIGSRMLHDRALSGKSRDRFNCFDRLVDRKSLQKSKK